MACKFQTVVAQHLPLESHIHLQYTGRMIYGPRQCPIRFVMGVLGDRWSPLIIRDMMFRGSTRFQDFLEADEGISTNILSDRLSRLEAQQIISRQRDPADGRQALYQLTGKGRDLLPVMLGVID